MLFRSIIPLAASSLVAVLDAQPPAAPVRDNSFLIEEAYNQEAGVVQHISLFAKVRDADDWLYTFTQEWPLFSLRHQLSATVPVIHSAAQEPSTGLGDIGLNYRFQLRFDDPTGVAIAPRLTLVLPTGDERKLRGAGAPGIEANLPISVDATPFLVLHVNVGGAITPRARGADGHRATLRELSSAASMIWLVSPKVNLMLEAAGSRAEELGPLGQRSWASTVVLSPGVRFAIDFASGLQIVPGFAWPMELSGSDDEDLFLVYLSFEHPFSRAGRR